MIIGLIVYGTLDSVTGGYLYDRRLVDQLRNSGHRVRVYSLPSRSYPLRLFDNFRGHGLNGFSSDGLDLLLQDELCHPSLLALNRRRKEPGFPPIIAIVHHLCSQEPRWRALNLFLQTIEKRYLDSVDAFIFNSRTTRATTFGLSPRPRPCVVAPPGSERFAGRLTPAEVEKRARLPGPLRLLYVGLVIPRKGLFEVIEALRRVPADRWRLEIAGCLTMAPAYVRRIRRHVRAHRLTSAVRFHGAISDEDLAAEYASAQLLCMPYAYEGFGIVAAEAMTMGLPVFGSTSGAVWEVVDDHITGRLFLPRDFPAVAAAVTDLHADRRRLARMSLAALNVSQQHPTWRRSMQKIDAFLGRFRSKIPRRISQGV